MSVGAAVLIGEVIVDFFSSIFFVLGLKKSAAEGLFSVEDLEEGFFVKNE